MDARFGEIRVKLVNGEPWFVGRDVASALHYSNPTKAVSAHVDDDDKLHSQIGNAGQMRDMLLINESGLYSLILLSRMEKAKEFKHWVTSEVLPQIRKTGSYNGENKIPDFAKRYIANLKNIPDGKFSVLTELYPRLQAKFEEVGYILPNVGDTGMVITPDISVGKCFANFLKNNYPKYYYERCTYKHHFVDGRADVDSTLYDLDALPMFIRYVSEVWIPEKAEKYFKKRDANALKHLPLLLDNGKRDN